VRNAGARESTADLLAFVDGDCVVQPEWLSDAINALRDPAVGLVGGGYVPNPAGTWIERCWTTSVAAPARTTAALPGGSMILRRATFEAVGRFDESLSAGEDDELCYRVRQAGLAVWSLPRCYVTHLGYPATLGAVAQRQIWHGASQLYVAESILDSQLLMTHLALVSALALIAAAVLGSARGVLGSAFLLLIPVMVLATRRASGRRPWLPTLMQLVPVGLFFYLGRAIGLVKNYWRLLARGLGRRKPA
jgi:GT2 family glycosyltransferase